MLTDAELLTRVKIGLFGNAAGNYRDEMLQVYIDEVKDFMQGAGVPESVINSEKSVGCILLGVNDLWNYSAGGVKLSDYFVRRVIQLAAGGGNNETA